MELSSLDYHYLAKEWQVLVGGKVQKVYLKERTHLIHIYSKGQFYLVLTDGAAFFTTSKLEWPKTPPGYCTFLRKRLNNARVVRIAQLGTDRVVTIDFETKEGPVRFVAELFGECNTLFLREDSIVSSLKTNTYADRTVRGGVKYVPPPPRPDPSEVPASELIGKPAAKAAAMTMGLGGKYSEELCARAGIRKSDQLSESNIAKLKTALEEMKEQTLSPVHSDDEALPFPFLTKPGSENWTKTSSFNEAVDAVMLRKLALAEQKVAAVETTRTVTKQEKILQAQRAHKHKIEEEAVNKQREGELIYENYTQLKELLENIKRDWKSMKLGEIRDKYGKHALVRAIHEDGTIEVELGEAAK